MVEKILYTRLFTVSLMIGMLLVGVSYITWRLRLVYTIHEDFIAFQVKQEALHQENSALLQQTINRLDSLERDLYGDIVSRLIKQEVKPPASKPTSASLEAWQKNQYKILVQRLEALERWRYEREK